MTVKWFAVHTGPNQESLADANLRRKGYWTFYPFERIRRRRKIPNRDKFRIEWVNEAYFPRYLFVAIRHESETVFDINETDGVSTVVYNGDEPLPIPGDVMTELMARGDGGGFIGAKDPLARKKFPEGAKVTFEEGSPLQGLVAAVSVDKGSQVRIWLEVLGKEREVSVDPTLLKAAE